ncbi:MAG: hypothetical protein ACK5M3_13565 [Dysgonomonas sp.]
MKKYLLCLLAIVILFPACSNDDNDEEYPYETVKGGGTFSRGNTVRLYYIDGEGKSLINPDNIASLPISYNVGEQPKESLIPKDYKDGFYNGNHNNIVYDEGLKLYYMMTSAYGDMEKHVYTFYIGQGSDFDKMDITYRYTDKDVIGGKYHAKIISWKFNNVHIYSDDDGFDKKVFIKKAQGKTTISFKY